MNHPFTKREVEKLKTKKETQLERHAKLREQAKAEIDKLGRRADAVVAVLGMDNPVRRELLSAQTMIMMLMNELRWPAKT